VLVGQAREALALAQPPGERLAVTDRGAQLVGQWASAISSPPLTARAPSPSRR
jgi:hypothetical protein